MSMIAVSIDGYVFSADILTISPHAASLLQLFNIDFLRQQQRIVDSERLASFYNQAVPVSDLDNYLKDPTSPMSNVTAFAAKFIRDDWRRLDPTPSSRSPPPKSYFDAHGGNRHKAYRLTSFKPRHVLIELFSLSILTGNFISAALAQHSRRMDCRAGPSDCNLFLFDVVTTFHADTFFTSTRVAST